MKATSYVLVGAAVLLSMATETFVFGKDAVEVTGVRVVKDIEDKTKKDFPMRAFNQNAGTSISLMVSHPQGGILKLDKEKSKIIKFVDDKGKDLATKPEKMKGKFSFGQKVRFGMFDKTSGDGKKLSLAIDSSHTPTSGAKSINVTGTIVLTTGSQKKTFKATNVAVKTGTEVKINGIPFVVGKAEKPKWGEDPWGVDLKTNYLFDKVAAVRFLGADGKEIKSQGAGTSWGGEGKNKRITKSYTFKKKVEMVTIEIDCWMDLKSVSVPFNISVGVGF